MYMKSFIFNNSQNHVFSSCIPINQWVILTRLNTTKKQLTNTIKHKNMIFENFVKMELSVFANKLFIYIYIYIYI